ncbi:hypothetical protein BGX29_006164 [Mortierella sp. GBA35]|nr:hypothetical protein BGX29_006164 [Mortierella sp. GBA35]
MFEVDNFISFHDLSPNGTFLWASPSIKTCLGYEPEEIEGVPAYDVMHKDDIAYCRVTHQENVLNDMVGTQIVIRFKHKDGSYVPCMAIFSVCFDYIVTCSTVIDTAQEAFRKVYTHSAAMTSIVGSRSKEFERIKRHHKAFGANTWNPNTLDPEPRACMILNRFSRNLGIMYASPSCQMIFKIDPDKAIGKPLLVFLRADDLAGFVEQAELAKSSNVVTHMRFWFQSPNCRQEIPCEAMLFGAADGLVAVLRRCRPFMRRQAITAGMPPSMDVVSGPPSYAGPRCTCGDNICRGGPTTTTTTTPSSSSSNGGHIHKAHPYHRNDTKGGDSSRRSHNHHHTQQQRHQPYSDAHCPVSTGSNHPNVMNGFTTNLTFSAYPSSSLSSYSSSESSSYTYSPSPVSTSSYSPSPAAGGYNTYATQSASNFRSKWFSTKTIQSPLQGIPIGSINSIRNLDKDQQRIRPLRSLQDDSLDIVDSNTELPASYRLRTHYIQEVGLEEAMSKLDTGLSDDEDNDNDNDYEVGERDGGGGNGHYHSNYHNNIINNLNYNGMNDDTNTDDDGNGEDDEESEMEMEMEQIVEARIQDLERDMSGMAAAKVRRRSVDEPRYAGQGDRQINSDDDGHGNSRGLDGSSVAVQ